MAQSSSLFCSLRQVLCSKDCAWGPHEQCRLVPMMARPNLDQADRLDRQQLRAGRDVSIPSGRGRFSTIGSPPPRIGSADGVTPG